jgi:hypothetical protein
MSVPPPPRFFGALPERGLWTTVGLRRGQFLAVLAVSLGLFVFVGGPLWSHVHDHHFARIAVSYGAIPIGVAVALRANGTLRPTLLVGGSAVIALLKLVLTAALLLIVAL